MSTPTADALPGSLHYSTDQQPGFSRVRWGRGFRYLDANREAVRDRALIQRFRALAIPPAWTEVWICSSPNGHLQATGRDARGRKQYRYHPRYRAARERAKYDRLAAFARVLPRIRRQVRRDLRRPGLPREKVLATIVALLERTLVRVGNREYARDNRSFGLTTLRDRHARVDGTRIRFRFRGKGGRIHEVDVHDRRLAGIVRRCQDLPGQELFQYLDEAGTSVDVRSDDVNAYLREAAGEDVSAKDFRTWAGTLLAYRMLRHLARSPAATEVARGSRKAILAAVRATATRLGNTASVCRQSYIHPAIFDAHLNGGLQAALGSGVGAGVESGVAGEGWASALEDAQAVVEQAADPDDGQTRRDEREMLRLLGSRSGTCRRASRRRPTSPRPARPARGAQARSR